MRHEYDIVILGAGPAGYPAAIRAAQMKARVCLVEKGPIGGVCLNWGCIPTKTLHALAHTLERVRSGAGAGVGGGPVRVDEGTLFAHKARVVSGLVSGVERILRERAVEIVRGEGRIASPGLVEIEGVGALRAKSIIVATGSEEITLPAIPFDGARILSSEDILRLESVPKSLIVIGGGVIGCEFASIFRALGAEVTVVEMLPRLVATEDAQVSRFLQSAMKKRGIALHLGAAARGASRNESGITVSLESGTELSAELALVAVGRRPSAAGIGLEEVGARLERGAVVVNEKMETGVDGIYAAGDAIGGWLLAHVATREGIVAAENALGADRRMSYEAIPTTIYTLPEAARVGLTEEAAKERGLDVATGRFPFAANGKAKGIGEEEGFVKWIASGPERRLIGLHIVGPHATELVAAGILAVRGGMTVEAFTASIFPHPTLSEALAEAAEAVIGRAIHIMR